VKKNSSLSLNLPLKILKCSTSGTGHSPMINDAERHIDLGNELFTSKASLEQGEIFFMSSMPVLSLPSQMVICSWHLLYVGERRYGSCPRLFSPCSSLSDSTGSPSPIAERALASISTIMFNTGNPLRALVYAKRDEEYAVHLGGIYEEARSHYKAGKADKRHRLTKKLHYVHRRRSMLINAIGPGFS
jgi:hypothetical protein